MRRWVLRLVAAYVLWRWLGPEPKPRFPAPQEHPLRLPGRSVFVGDRELFVREAGPPDGPPIVLLHGWATDSLLSWYKIIPLLAERFRVVAVDQRNTGKSDHARSRYNVADAADETAALIGILGLGRVPVVGYSMGGMIAQELAHRHPHLTDRVVLAATAATIVPTEGQRRWTMGLLWAGRTWDRISKAELSLVRHRYLTRVGAVDRAHERWLWENYLARDVNASYEGGFAAVRFDSREWAGRLDIAALVIIPTRDQLIAPSLQYELAELLRRATVAELDSAGHEAVHTHAEEIAAAVLDFLD